MLQVFEHKPIRPSLPQKFASPQSDYNEELENWKSTLLDDLYFFDKMEVLVSNNLQDLHYIKNHATCTEIVILYLKNIMLR